jgi:hypothetical protein
MADTALPERNNARALTLALVIAAIVPYLQTLAFGYVLDDTYAIRGNATLNGWSSLGGVWLEQFGGDAGPFFGLYRPLTATLFAVVWNGGGKWPLWFHVMAILLHVAATLLVWRLLQRAVARGPALLGTTWFAVHPVHVEAVANITNTSEVLVAIWAILLALHLQRRAATEEPLSWRAALVAGALYLAAMLSKESGAMAAPVALLVAWGWQRDPAPSVSWIVRRWWRVFVTFTVAVLLVAIMRSLVLGGPVTGQPIAALGIVDMSAAERISAMMSLIPKIALLLLVPPGLNPHYGPSTFPASRAAVAMLGVLLLFAAFACAVVLARRRDRRLIVALGLTVLAFLPASNILVATGQVLAERTLYLSSVGMAMAVAALLERMARFAETRPRTPAWVRAVSLAFLLLTALNAANAIRWTGHWRNHETLFARMIAADSRGYAGYWLAGVEATLQKRPAEGLALFERAYALEKRDRGLVLDYGASLTNHGHRERAAAVYREGLELAPQDSTLNARLRALQAR